MIDDLSQIDRWLADPSTRDFSDTDLPGALQALERRLVDAWEHNRDEERVALLHLKKAILEFQEEKIQQAELAAENRPVEWIGAGVCRFSTLSQALRFIAGCIEQSDARRLFAALARLQRPGRDDARYFAERIFPQLVACHHEIDFRARYRDRHFPPGETRFKLGGHLSELGCLHIDFVKSGPGWLLEDISICR